MELRTGYKNTDLGVIPHDWDIKTLGDIGDSLIGLTYHPSQVRNYGTLVLRSSNIQDGSLCFENNVFVEAPIPERIMVRYGDILVCVRNGSRDLIGKSALINNQAEGATFGAFMAIFRSKYGQYLYYIFQSDIFKKQINQYLGATINQITNKSLSSFRVPLPSSDKEQNKIINTLSDIDALLTMLDKIIAKKRDMKQATMEQLLSCRTRIPNFKEDWEEKNLSDIAFISKGTQLPTDKIDTYGNFPHYNGGVDPSSFTFQSNAPADTIAISEGGNSCGYVHFIAKPFWCGGHCYNIVPKSVHNKFLYHALKGRQTSIMGLRVGSGLPNVQKTALGLFKLIIPSNYAEQTEIANILSDMDEELFKLEVRRNKTKELKQAMMHELLTGKTRLVNKEPIDA